MRILLIHGFAADLETWFYTKKPAHAGFEVFGEQVDAHEISVFRWGVPLHLSFFDALLPEKYAELYDKEHELATSLEMHHDLNGKLIQDQPHTVIAHSMGCLLFALYVLEFGMPQSVKKVVFVNADVGEKEILQSGIIRKCQFINIYQPLDFALWLSTLYNKRMPVGIKSIKNKEVTNIFIPSFKTPNIHTSILRDPRLAKIV